MKETLRALNSSVHRPGVALMVTLGIMALIAVVILGNLRLVDDSMNRNKQTQAFNQGQAMFKSLESLLKKQLAKIDSESSLDAFLVSIHGLGDDKGLLELGLDISSLQGKININAIFKEDNKTIAPQYQNVFLRLFEAYKIKDGHQLLALIADTIDSDNSERYPNSELINQYSGMSQGLIVDAKHLSKIAAFYDEAMQDPNVHKIPWDDYFRYGEPHITGIIDCNYLDRSLAFFMGIQKSNNPLERGNLGCGEINGDYNATKADFQIEPFSRDKPYHLQVKSDYKALDSEGKLSFILEIKSKEISHLRSY